MNERPHSLQPQPVGKEQAAGFSAKDSRRRGSLVSPVIIALAVIARLIATGQPDDMQKAISYILAAAGFFIAAAAVGRLLHHKKSWPLFMTAAIVLMMVQWEIIL